LEPGFTKQVAWKIKHDYIAQIGSSTIIPVSV